ncbi:MAG: glycosyltransferase family 2 protein [Planctomycetota bacterium]|nr:MAG: glycosyltransferase family 2 protein [Planctomycetota bacterium]
MVSKFRTCLIIPTFNNVSTIGGVVEEARKYISSIIVVDDGSWDGSARILARKPVITVTHRRNLGKGAAILSGLQAARRYHFDFAITMDGDAQHRAQELEKFLEVISRLSSPVLVLGVRDLERIEHVTWRTRWGLFWANVLLYLSTGKWVPDSQCGMRAYPVVETLSLGARGRRFDFESEVLLLAIRRGIPLFHLPVEVDYPPSFRRISHYRPFWDSVRILLLHFRYWLGRG